MKKHRPHLNLLMLRKKWDRKVLCPSILRDIMSTITLDIKNFDRKMNRIILRINGFSY